MHARSNGSDTFFSFQCGENGQQNIYLRAIRRQRGTYLIFQRHKPTELGDGRDSRLSAVGQIADVGGLKIRGGQLSGSGVETRN